MTEPVAPVDPIRFDFGLNFKPAGDRIQGERAERLALAARELPFHVPFLDDIIGGIMPHDLVVIGAETGVGKTALVTGIAKASARAGRRVFYFALEAEDREIERRIKYEIIAEFCKARALPFTDAFNYPDWYRGKFEGAIGAMNIEVDALIARQFGGLRTFYKGSKFDHDMIRKQFQAVQEEADLIILDHLHYVDIEDEDENRGYKRTVKMIRDTALEMGKPVILVVHLRKKSDFARGLVPELDRVMGSSDIAKICTHAVMLAPCRVLERQHWAEALTFVHVPKDRLRGATGFVAVCGFDLRFRTYGQSYALGRLEDYGEHWTEIPFADRPGWATKCRPFGGQGAAPVTTKPEETPRRRRS
jgi:nucleoside-triphosphatase THEP1